MNRHVKSKRTFVTSAVKLALNDLESTTQHQWRAKKAVSYTMGKHFVGWKKSRNGIEKETKIKDEKK